MLGNNSVQQAWIEYLQTNADVLVLSSNFPDEIREENWQGEKFIYPNIRVMCEVTGGECLDDIFTVISCFSEQKSSKEAQNMAHVVANNVHNKTFTSNGIRVSTIQVKTPRAVQESGIWRADIQVNAKAK